MPVHHYSGPHVALYDALPEFNLHGNYTREKTGDFSWFEKSALYGGTERQGGEAVYGVVGSNTAINYLFFEKAKRNFTKTSTSV